MKSKSRDEAIAAGVNVDDVQHTMKRRLSSHDYHDVGTYMLTLVVEDRLPLFGRLCGTAEAPMVELSGLGEAIRDIEQKKISQYYPMVEVWKLCIMPDHLHLIVRVKAPLPEGRHLGHVVSGFKSGCSRAWWVLQDANIPCGEPQGTRASTPASPSSAASIPAAASSSAAASAVGSPLAPVPGGSPLAPVPVGSPLAPVPVGSPLAPMPGGSPLAPVPGGSPPGAVSVRRPVLFEKGYCDKVLLRNGQLDNWKRYLDDNPRRLFIKRLHPEFFTVLHHVRLMDMDCQVIGNRFLLDIPDKAAIIVHRAYSDQEFERYRQQWLALGEAGGVLVSAAIAPREKQVMREALDRGYRLVLLRENGFPPLYKPSGETFDACSEGRLLQVSPWPYHMQRRIISREQCLLLNRMAKHLANTPRA